MPKPICLGIYAALCRCFVSQAGKRGVRERTPCGLKSQADILPRPQAGIVNEIVAPFPASLSAQILPLCASTRYLAIDKPNPIPPESLDL
jgi:hypothetical protein